MIAFEDFGPSNYPQYIARIFFLYQLSEISFAETYAKTRALIKIKSRASWIWRVDISVCNGELSSVYTESSPGALVLQCTFTIKLGNYKGNLGRNVNVGQCLKTSFGMHQICNYRFRVVTLKISTVDVSTCVLDLQSWSTIRKIFPRVTIHIYVCMYISCV